MRAGRDRSGATFSFLGNVIFWFGRRRVRRSLVATGLAVMMVAGLGGWLASGAAQRQGITRVTGPPDCPLAVVAPPPRRAGLDLRIVPVLPLPVGPVRATVCHYSGGLDRSEKNGPVASGSGSLGHGAVLDAVRTAEVAGWLDSGRAEVAAGQILNCPAGDGSLVLITFRYADGPPVQVTVRRTGCRAVSNGVRTELPRTDVLTLIDGLVPPP